MSYGRARHVFRVRSTGLSVFFFVLATLYAVWLAVLILADQQGWEPQGRWALMPTRTWAWLGLGLFVIIIVYYLALLTRREVPARAYVFDTPTQGAPSFLSEKPPGESPPPSPPAPQG